MSRITLTLSASLLVAFSATAASASVLGQACANQALRQAKEEASIRKSMKTCRATKSSPDAIESTCADYEDILAELLANSGRLTVASVTVESSPGKYDSYDLTLDCARRALTMNGQPARLQFRGGDVVRVSWKGGDAVELRLRAGMGVVLKPGSVEELEAAGLNAGLALRTDCGGEGPYDCHPVGVISRKAHEQRHDLVVKSYGPRIGFNKDSFEGIDAELSLARIGGRKTELSYASLAFEAFYPAGESPTNDSTVDGFFAKQLDYVAFFRELQQLSRR